LTNLREPFAATHHAGLGWEDGVEKAIDRVAASGRADALGVLLWKAKYMSESPAYVDARKRLIVLYREKRSVHETPVIVEKIVDQVLHEYLSDRCRMCLGAKELVTEQLRVVCEACAGTGVRRYGDSERARTMQIGVDRVRRLSRAMQWLADEINGRDAQVNDVLGVQLERFTL
jgi:hypothetical protein